MHLAGKTATGLPVPAEVVEQLRAGKRVAVVVTIGGYSYRTTVAPMAGEFFVPLAAEHREAAGVSAGQEIDVDIAVDDQPREVVVPEDVAAALGEARAGFDALAYSHRKEWVRWVEGAKKPETRANRVAKTVEAIRAGKGRR